MIDNDNGIIQDVENNNNSNVNNNTGCLTYMPCAKFIVASIVSVGVCAFGMTMLATGGTVAPLAPFYSSLISGSVLYWCPSPSVSSKKK